MAAAADRPEGSVPRARRAASPSLSLALLCVVSQRTPEHLFPCSSHAACDAPSWTLGLGAVYRLCRMRDDDLTPAVWTRTRPPRKRPGAGRA